MGQWPVDDAALAATMAQLGAQLAAVQPQLAALVEQRGGTLVLVVSPEVAALLVDEPAVAANGLQLMQRLPDGAAVYVDCHLEAPELAIGGVATALAERGVACGDLPPAISCRERDLGDITGAPGFVAAAAALGPRCDLWPWMP